MVFVEGRSRFFFFLAGIAGPGDEPLTEIGRIKITQASDPLGVLPREQRTDLPERRRPLHGQHGKVSAVLQGDIEALRLCLHPGEIFFAGGAVHDQAVRLTRPVDNQVIDDPAGLVAHGRVERLAIFLEAGDIIGQQALEIGGAVDTLQIDHGHVRHIEQTGITPHLMMFLDLGAVMDGHVPAAEIDHFRAGVEMGLVQRCPVSHGKCLRSVGVRREPAPALAIYARADILHCQRHAFTPTVAHIIVPWYHFDPGEQALIIGLAKKSTRSIVTAGGTPLFASVVRWRSW